MKTLAEQLTQLRAARGIDRGTLAGRAGIDYNYLWRLERGERRNPSLTTLAKLARALSLSVEELVAGTSFAPEFAGEVQELAERLSSLPKPLRVQFSAALLGLVTAVEEHLLAQSAAIRAAAEAGAELDEDDQAALHQLALDLVHRRAALATPADDVSQPSA